MNRNGPNQTFRDNNGRTGINAPTGTDKSGRFWIHFDSVQPFKQDGVPTPPRNPSN